LIRRVVEILYNNHLRASCSNAASQVENALKCFHLSKKVT
jgi:hypothetical protein